MKKNVLPRPGVLSTRTRPPWASTIPLTMGKPGSALATSTRRTRPSSSRRSTKHQSASCRAVRRAMLVTVACYSSVVARTAPTSARNRCSVSTRRCSVMSRRMTVNIHEATDPRADEDRRIEEEPDVGLDERPEGVLDDEGHERREKRQDRARDPSCDRRLGGNRHRRMARRFGQPSHPWYLVVVAAAPCVPVPGRRSTMRPPPTVN